MPKTTPEPLTKEEIDALLTASASNLFYHTLFQLARHTGRRLGEFYGVEIKKKVGEKEIPGKFKKVYTQDGNRIEVPVKKSIYKSEGKYQYGLKAKDFIFHEDGTSTMRTFVLKRRNYVQDESFVGDAVTSLVKTFIKKYKISLDDYMFRRRTYRAIQHAITSYAKKAGIKKNVSMHSFRHHFTTHLLKKGWSYDKVAKITGHKSITSLKSYDHVLSSDLKDKLREDLKGI